MPSFMERVKTSWNVLTAKEFDLGPGQSIASSVPSGSHTRLRYDTSKTVLAPI